MNWSTWIATGCAVAAVALSARPLHWAFNLIQGTHDFITEWPKMREAIAELRTEVAAIQAETQPNGGNSMRDFIHRTARDVADIKDEQVRLRTQIELRHPPERL